jgi:hypothetical protein
MPVTTNKDSRSRTLISKPIVQDIIGGYKYIWCEGQEEVFAATIKHVHQDGARAIYGEITIEHEFEEFPKISGIRFNLLATRGRNEISKRIEDLHLPFEVNWTDLIEQVCSETIERVRLGEPVKEIQINSDDELLTPNFILEPFITEGIPTILFGEKGIRKSGLSLLFSACLNLPWYDNPLGFTTTKVQNKTLILDWETEEAAVKYEAQRLARGMQIPSFPLYYRRCGLPLADDLEQIQERIEKTNAKVIIIDSLGGAAGGELNKPDVALRFFSALRKLKITSFIIAQTSKNPETNKSTIFGSTYFQYYARSIFEIVRVGEDIGSDIMHVAIFHRAANLVKRHPAIGFSFTFSENGDAVTIKSEPVSVAALIDKLVKIPQKIIALLNTGPRTSDEIVNLLGSKRNTINQALYRLKDRNEVVKIDDEKWGLISRKYDDSDNGVTNSDK